MERERNQYAEYPRPRVHWSVKLLAYAWIVALVFIAGMVLGRMLSGDGMTQEFGADPEAQEAQKASLVLDVPCLDQKAGFPTGCESVTAVMALDYAGVDIPVEEFVDEYLPQGEAPYEEGGEYYCSDPNQCFLGDPRSEDGWGCYAPVIREAVERALADRESMCSVAELSGKTLEELIDEYVRSGVPVILWGTVGMEFPSYGPPLTVKDSGRRFDWIRPEHCLLLVGETEDTYVFNDPMEGKQVAYEKQAVEFAYQALGSQALAITN